MPTKIEWTDEVWNPKISDVRTHPDRLDQPLRWKRPRKIFVNSMSDLFHDKIPLEFLYDCLAVMALSSQHIHQVLTRRIGRAAQLFSWKIGPAGRQLTPLIVQEIIEKLENWNWLPPRSPKENNNRQDILSDLKEGERWPLPNVWLGVSVEDQKTADERIPPLLQTPAAVRFVSYEPALGPVGFRQYVAIPDDDGHCARCGCVFEDEMDENGKHACPPGFGPSLDWIIAGGESGPHARPSHPAWFRAVRDQCVAAGVPFFFKQWGKWAPPETQGCKIVRGTRDDRWISVSIEGFGKPLPVGTKIHHWNDGGLNSVRVGKKRAGRLLDGREWNEFPASV